MSLSFVSSIESIDCKSAMLHDIEWYSYVRLLVSYVIRHVCITKFTFSTAPYVLKRVKISFEIEKFWSKPHEWVWCSSLWWFSEKMGKMTKILQYKLNQLIKNLQRPLFSVRIEVLSMHGRSECVEKCNGRLPRPDEFLNEDFKIPGDRNYRIGFIIHIS